MERLLAAGGVLGAFATSSCCALPLALAAAGVSCAWIGTMTALAPLQPVFLTAAALCVGLGLWRMYGRRPPVCEGQACAKPGPRRLTKAALWFAAGLALLGGSAEWWARLLV